MTELPDDATLCDLEPEEVAGYLMAHLNRLPQRQQEQGHILQNFVQGQRSKYSKKALLNLSAAWAWCRREGFLVPSPREIMTTVQVDDITTRGAQVKGPADINAWRARARLPREVLHPRVSGVVWSDFLRGDYASAIFKAFKAVEELVREVGNYSPLDLGTKLMREAFAKGGPLADSTLPESERESEAHVFAGAIGAFKNPGSHRTVNVQDPAYAVEAIMFASLLARIADSRRPAKP